ncbi:MAG: hypothetical protein J7496_03430 [Novosphingobium sp.]|nr:hypothetical protein [Novosphingobium sp.]MBO9601543.1 hypothetical protein [Novosphingobium sp.]
MSDRFSGRITPTAATARLVSAGSGQELSAGETVAMMPVAGLSGDLALTAPRSRDAAAMHAQRDPFRFTPAMDAMNRSDKSHTFPILSDKPSTIEQWRMAARIGGRRRHRSRAANSGRRTRIS